MVGFPAYFRIFLLDSPLQRIFKWLGTHFGVISFGNGETNISGEKLELTKPF
jgi:hypothetical protein